MTGDKKCILGFQRPIKTLLIGGKGGVGGALARLIATECRASVVVSTSRDADWVNDAPERDNITRMQLDLTNDASCAQLANTLRVQFGHLDCVINCSGLLHDGPLGPERTWRHIDPGSMERIFKVNTFGVALAIKHCLPLLVKTERTVFASLSARVGSIGDNRLGGWYSYRASKAAQNMLLKCAAIEAKRLWRQLICVALHPGTVDTQLSSPFTSRTPPDKLFAPEKSARHLAEVIKNLVPENTGGFYAWDGSEIEF